MGLRRLTAAAAATGLLAVQVVAPPLAWAVSPPVIDPGALPADDTPGPGEPMRQMFGCATPVVIADPNVAQPAPGNVMMNLKQAWQYSTGAGVKVAIIDTGVTPNPRVPQRVGGGDYVMGGADGGLELQPHALGPAQLGGRVGRRTLGPRPPPAAARLACRSAPHYRGHEASSTIQATSRSKSMPRCAACSASAGSSRRRSWWTTGPRVPPALVPPHP